MDAAKFDRLFPKAAPGLPAGYADWRKKVNAAVWRKAGLSVDDLPDFDLISAFEDGASPSKAAAAAIRAAKDGLRLGDVVRERDGCHLGEVRAIDQTLLVKIVWHDTGWISWIHRDELELVSRSTTTSMQGFSAAVARNRARIGLPV
jgi:hypothetical protein